MVWEELKKLDADKCILVTIQIDDWNNLMSPWEAKAVFKGGDDFGGGADEYINRLQTEIIPKVLSQIGAVSALNPDGGEENKRPLIIAGYSLAGLFALYSMYRTDIFSSAVSASGSMWFPGFFDFAQNNKFCGAKTKNAPDRIYLSLGDKESRTRNEYLRENESITKSLCEHCKRQGIDSIFELNPGNHFSDANLRVAKGIAWSL